MFEHLVPRAAAVGLLAAAASPPSVQADAIGTDRPTRSSASCTVPDGRWQVEADLYTGAQLETAGRRERSQTLLAPVLKHGVSDADDLQLALPLRVLSDVRDGPDRVEREGVGDLTLRWKHRLTEAGQPVGVALIPAVKLPTAIRGIGNGQVEGSLAAAINVPIGPAVLTLVPTVDVLANRARASGRHAQISTPINVAVGLPGRLTLIGELWAARDFDPAGSRTLQSADAALVWLLTPDLQLDVGGFRGLNRHTPSAIQVGVSVRW